MLNRLDEAIEKNRGQREMAAVLREMVGYTQEHFAFEEKLMAEADYPGLRRTRPSTAASSRRWSASTTS